MFHLKQNWLVVLHPTAIVSNGHENKMILYESTEEFIIPTYPVSAIKHGTKCIGRSKQSDSVRIEPLTWKEREKSSYTNQI